MDIIRECDKEELDATGVAKLLNQPIEVAKDIIYKANLYLHKSGKVASRGRIHIDYLYNYLDREGSVHNADHKN